MKKRKTLDMDEKIAKIYALEEKVGFWVTLKDDGFDIASFSILKSTMKEVMASALQRFILEDLDSEYSETALDNVVEQLKQFVIQERPTWKDKNSSDSVRIPGFAARA